MLEGFTRTEIKTSGARIVTVHGGKGPPLLLMHGNPFTHLSWHKFAPRLAEEFTVVATDLRGYGDSEKPPGGDDHSGYSFRAMAQDQVEVMAALGFHALLCRRPRPRRARAAPHVPRPSRKVARAAILDIIPQHYLFNNVTQVLGDVLLALVLHIQPYDLPERMMSADPDFFIKKKLAKTEQGLSFFDPAALAGLHALLPQSGDDPCYLRGLPRRATSTSTWTTEDFEAGRKINCPVLLLWGATGGVGRNHKSMEIWPRYASDIRGGKALPCGHYYPKRRRTRPMRSYAHSSRTAS